MQDTSKMNVVKIDNKYYVKKVKHAKCIKKVGEEYTVSCEIKMRGSNCYTYNRETDYIIKDSYIKDGVKLKNVLYLEKDALRDMQQVVLIMQKKLHLVISVIR